MKDFKLIVELLLVRAFSSLSYLVLATAYLPSSAIQRDIYILSFYEFLFGMAAFPLRTNSLIHQNKEKALVMLCAVLSLSAVSYVLLFDFDVHTFFLAVVLSALFPYSLMALVRSDRINVRHSANIEAKATLLGSTAAGIFFFLIHSTTVLDSYISPLYRLFFVQLILLFFLHRYVLPQAAGIDFSSQRFSIKDTYILLSGVDYLAVFALLRVNLLTATSVFVSPILVLSYKVASQDILKAMVLIYDPFAAIFGYFLKFRFAGYKFNVKRYARSTASFFITLSVSGFLLVALSELSGLNILIAPAVILFMLIGAGLSTQVAGGNGVIRLSLCAMFLSSLGALNLGMRVSLPLCGMFISIVFVLLLYGFRGSLNE